MSRLDGKGWIRGSFMLALVLLTLGAVGALMRRAGRELFLGGRLLLYTAVPLCFAAAFALLTVTVILLTVRTGRLRWLLPVLLLIPLLLFAALTFSLRRTIDADRTVVVHRLDTLEREIVIDNWSALLLGCSEIYERQSGILLRHVATVHGDDGYRPLEDEETFTVTDDGDRVLLEYQGVGKGRLLLRVENGHLVAVDDPSN